MRYKDNEYYSNRILRMDQILWVTLAYTFFNLKISAK